MKELKVKDLKDWDITSKELLQYAKDRTIFVFSGEIGAGKTTFIQAICRQLGIPKGVTSPTFSLVNEYVIEQQKGELIYHLDLYRLKNLDEAIDIGLEELLYSGHYCFIEWPEIIEPILEGEDVVRIQIQIVEDSTRKVVFL